MNYSLKKLLILGVALELLILLASYLLTSSFEETIRLAARYSGRLSALIFLFTFYLFAQSYPQPLEKNIQVRNFIKLFAVLHVIHLGFLSFNVYLNSIPLETVKLIGGALAYAMIVAAPFVLHKIKVKFQMIYFYYVSLVMVLTVVARVKGDFEGAEPFWLHYVILTTLIFCAALFGFQMKRKTGLLNTEN